MLKAEEKKTSYLPSIVAIPFNFVICLLPGISTGRFDLNTLCRSELLVETRDMGGHNRYYVNIGKRRVYECKSEAS